MTDASFGLAEPLGVTLRDGGANVAVYSAESTQIELCLFDESGVETCIALPARTGNVHHGFINDLKAGQVYGFRAYGPWQPEEGLRFNPAKLLIDPYATRLLRPQDMSSSVPTGLAGFDDLTYDAADTAPLVPKCVIEAPVKFKSRPARPRPENRIIYELHVKGFTALHAGVPEALRGTMAGLAHPASIKHLVDLGVTTVELMPLMAWADERHLPPLGLSNYWGYNPLCFLAPDPRLAPGGMAEVAAAVDALHAAGLEVILDVVFNHSAESDERGQTFSFRGLDNRTYYRLADNKRYYINDTGCGHTLALDRPPVWRLAMDALRHWALVGGIDGFRFDLATIMARGDAGFDPDASLLAAIEQDPVLRDRVMIAEPWDIGPGGYQLGAFPARWAEWSDKYRDDVRRFWRGDGAVGTLATRLAGSSDVFGGRYRHPSASVNFASAHDGFALADVVSYADKRNMANGENNRDGHSGEICWTNGVDGPSDALDVIAARKRDIKALLATVLLSRGTPMIGMGDELGRTQRGNNNAYAQDNAITWLDWSALDLDLLGFTQRLIALRKSLPLLTADRFLTGQGDALWLNQRGRPMEQGDWADNELRSLGLMLADPANMDEPRTLIWLHAGHDALKITLPEAHIGFGWKPALASAQDVAGDALASFQEFELQPRCVIVFCEVKDKTVRRAGVDPALVDQLSDAAGIAGEWWEVSGKRTAVSTQTKRALLDAMGFATATPEQARESLDALRTLQPDDTVATGQCFIPEALEGGQRRFGVAAHVYTLRQAGDWGIGDFHTMRTFANLAGDQGAATLAVNPFHAMFPSDRTRVSPYQPSDRRFLDPIYIGLDGLPEIETVTAYLKTRHRQIMELWDAKYVDYAAVWEIKREVLIRCFAVLKNYPDRYSAYLAFRAQGGEALEQFALFQALEIKTGSSHAVPASIGKPTNDLKPEIDFAVYLQFLAESQLGLATKTSLSIGLYRDLAVGAAVDGAELWSARSSFLKGVSVGAPPDPFSADGQIWNLPPLDPVAMLRDGCAHFRALLQANMRHAGALRIDHVMALRRLFLVPDGAKAGEGAYLRYPLEAMLRVLAEESQRARCMVVGEDLGTVPEGFRERLAKANVFSYRVLFFERDGHAFRSPQTYPANAAACVATHDLPTLKGWWSGADITLDHALGRTVAADAAVERTADKAALLDALGRHDTDLTPDLVGAIHGHLASAPSALIFAQAEDLVGEVDPVNLPGTVDEYPNWRRKLSVEIHDVFTTDTAKATLSAIKKAGR